MERREVQRTADRDADFMPRAEAQPHAEQFDGIRTRRVAAFLIDAGIIAVATALLWLVAIGPVLLSFGLLHPALLLATALLPLAYHTWCVGGPRHATLGMQVLRLRVVNVDGSSPGFGQAALHTLTFYGSIVLTNLLILGVSFFNDRGRCLHDYLTGSLVLNADRP